MSIDITKEYEKLYNGNVAKLDLFESGNFAQMMIIFKSDQRKEK